MADARHPTALVRAEWASATGAAFAVEAPASCDSDGSPRVCRSSIDRNNQRAAVAAHGAQGVETCFAELPQMLVCDEPLVEQQQCIGIALAHSVPERSALMRTLPLPPPKVMHYSAGSATT